MSLLIKVARHSKTIRTYTNLVKQPTRFIHNDSVARQASTVRITDTLKESNNRTIRGLPMQSLQGINNDLNKLNRDIDELNKASNILFKGSELMEHIDSRYNFLSPKEKTQKLNEIWSKIKENNQQIKFEHYFTYLRLLINQSNEINIEQIESIVNEITQKDMESHPQIYELKFKAYCLNGSLEKAQNLLSFMKEKKLSVNDDIFNSLIVCYLNNSKEQEAEQIYEMMMHRNLKPTYDTFRGIFNYYLILNKNFDKFNYFYDKMLRLESVRVFPVDQFRLISDCIHYDMTFEDLSLVMNKINIKPSQAQVVVGNAVKLLLHKSRADDALNLIRYTINKFEKIQYSNQTISSAKEGLSVDEEARYLIETKTDEQLKYEVDKIANDLYDNFSSSFLKNFDLNVIKRAADHLEPIQLANLFNSLFYNCHLIGNSEAAMSLVNFIGEKELFSVYDIRANHLVPIFLHIMRSQDLEMLKEFARFRQKSFLKRIPFVLDEPRELSYFNRCSIEFLIETNKYLLERDDEELVSFKLNYFSAQLFELVTDKRHKSGELIKNLDLYKLLMYSYENLDKNKELSNLILLNKMFNFRIFYPINILMNHLFSLDQQSENKNDITDLISQENLDSFLKLLNAIFTNGSHTSKFKFLNKLQQFYKEFVDHSPEQLDARSKFICEKFVKANLKLGKLSDLKILKIPDAYFNDLLYTNDQYVREYDTMNKRKQQIEAESWNEDEIDEIIREAKLFQEDTSFLKFKKLLINLNRLDKAKPDELLIGKIDVLISNLKNLKFIFDRKSLLQLIDYYLDIKSDTKTAKMLFDYCINTDTLVNSFFDPNAKLKNYKSEYLNKITEKSEDQVGEIIESVALDSELFNGIDFISLIGKNADYTNENVNLSKLIDSYLKKSKVITQMDFIKIIKSGKINTAIELIKRSINNMENFDLPHFDLVYQLISTEQFDTLQSYIDFLIEQKPQDKNRIYNDLFSTLIRHGHIDKARFIAENQPDFIIDPTRIFLNASYLYSQKKYDNLSEFVNSLKEKFYDILPDFSIFDYLLIKLSLKTDKKLNDDIISNLNEFNRKFLQVTKNENNDKKELDFYLNFYEFLNEFASKDSSRVNKKIVNKYLSYLDSQTRYKYYNDLFDNQSDFKEKFALIRSIALDGDYETIEKFSLKNETMPLNFCRFELAIAYSRHNNKIDHLIEIIQKDYNYLPFYFMPEPNLIDVGENIEDDVFDKIVNRIGIDRLRKLFEECPKSEQQIEYRNLAKKFARYYLKNDDYDKYNELVNQYRLFDINFYVLDFVKDAVKENKVI